MRRSRRGMAGASPTMTQLKSGAEHVMKSHRRRNARAAGRHAGAGATGRVGNRDRHRHRAGPVRADRRASPSAAVNGMRMRIDEVNAAGRHQRPQAAAGGRGPRLRSEEGRARRAEDGAAGQDLRRARLDRHRRPRWRRCRSISTTRSRTCFRSPARARCSSRCTAEVSRSRRRTTTRSAPAIKRAREGEGR